jgi:hypothetical protein
MFQRSFLSTKTSLVQFQGQRRKGQSQLQGQPKDLKGQWTEGILACIPVSFIIEIFEEEHLQPYNKKIDLIF